MQEQFMKQAGEFIEAAQKAGVPENFQNMTKDGLAKTREAYAQMSVAAEGTSKVFEDVTSAAQSAAKEVGDQVLENMAANTEAAFEAAEAVVHSRSLPEAAKLQADFIQQQIAIAGEQTKAFYELSNKVATEAFNTAGDMTTKAVKKAKKAK